MSSLHEGVFVEVPSLSSEDNTITLRGPQEKLGVALTQVYEKVTTVYLTDYSIVCLGLGMGLSILATDTLYRHVMCFSLFVYIVGQYAISFCMESFHKFGFKPNWTYTVSTHPHSTLVGAIW